MKIAIVCDWLVTIGGAEKVLEQILKCFPESDLFAVIDYIPQESRSLILNKTVTTTFIQKIPFAKTSYRKYLSFMPLAIEQLDLSKYDVIISSSHSVAKGVITGPNQLHICYCHSPMRYLWDLQNQYLRELNLESGFKSWIVRFLLHRLRIWDVRTSNGVDSFLANSKFIARRIEKVYRRDATVMYPPVHIPSIVKNLEKQDFYITASRIVPYKKIDLVVDAFINMPDRKLIIIGSGQGLNKIKSKARGANNIQILGYQPDEILKKYLAEAKAFIFAAEEDFGILPVEAQALGTPVIAYGKGGVRESVIGYEKNSDLATGVFFNEQDTVGLIEAVKYFETVSHLISSENCINNAQRFSEDRFCNEFKSFVIDRFNKFQASQIK